MNIHNMSSGFCGAACKIVIFIMSQFPEKQILSTKKWFPTTVSGLQVLCLSGREIGPTGQRHLLMDILGARMLIMWEEQLVDSPIAYINLSPKMYLCAKRANKIIVQPKEL